MDLAAQFIYQQKVNQNEKVIAHNNEPAIEPAMEAASIPYSSVDFNERSLDINPGQSLTQSSRIAQPFGSSLKQPLCVIFRLFK